MCSSSHFSFFHENSDTRIVKVDQTFVAKQYSRGTELEKSPLFWTQPSLNPTTLFLCQNDRCSVIVHLDPDFKIMLPMDPTAILF